MRAGERRDAGALVLGLVDVVVRGGGGSDAGKRNGVGTRAGDEVEFAVAVAGDSGDVTANERVMLVLLFSDMTRCLLGIVSALKSELLVERVRAMLALSALVLMSLSLSGASEMLLSNAGASRGASGLEDDRLGGVKGEGVDVEEKGSTALHQHICEEWQGGCRTCPL